VLLLYGLATSSTDWLLATMPALLTVSTGSRNETPKTNTHTLLKATERCNTRFENKKDGRYKSQNKGPAAHLYCSSIEASNHQPRNHGKTRRRRRRVTQRASATPRRAGGGEQRKEGRSSKNDSSNADFGSRRRRSSCDSSSASRRPRFHIESL